MALAAAAALACAAVLAVQAYTVRSLQADNVLTFGNVKIRLLETTLENGQETPVANGYADRVDADTGASRIVRVQNAGDAACWVRVRLDMEAARRARGKTPLRRLTIAMARAWTPRTPERKPRMRCPPTPGCSGLTRTARAMVLLHHAAGRCGHPQSSSRRSPSTPMRLPRWAFRMIRRFTWIFGHGRAG